MGDGAVKDKTVLHIWALLSMLQYVITPPPTHAIGWDSPTEQCFDRARDQMVYFVSAYYDRLGELILRSKNDISASK